MAATTLITGATGLIGSQVVAAWPAALGGLVPSVQVDLLRPGAPQRLLDSTRPQRVLHLAWVASSTPGYRHDPRNSAWVEATLALVAECRARGIAFVGTGSIVETADGADLYAAAKQGLRRRLDPLISEGAICWLQPHYVFSVAARSPELVRAGLQAKESGSALELRTPAQAHDFVDVRDVASAILAVVRAGLAGCIPIGAGRTRTAAEVVEALGATVSPFPADAPKTGSTPPADISALVSIGWRPAATKEFFGDQ